MASVFVLLEAFNRKEAAALGFFPCATASFFINVTSSQKNALSCGMIKPQSINKKDVANMEINHDAGYLQAEKQRIIKDQRKESLS